MLCAVHTSGNGARPSGQQYSLFSCCNTLSADSSTFRLTITRHKSRISCLCSCDNNFMLGKQINGKRKKWLTNSSFFSRTLLFFPEYCYSTAMSHASLDCNTTPELCHDGDDGTIVGRWYSSDVMIDGGGFCFATRGDWETLLFFPNFFFFFSSSRRMRPGLLALPLSVTRLPNCHVDGHVWWWRILLRNIWPLQWRWIGTTFFFPPPSRKKVFSSTAKRRK